MARAVSMETGEIVVASSATIPSNLIPIIPSAERAPLQAKRDRPLLEQQVEGRSTEIPGSGTFNIVPSPPPVASYAPAQYLTYPTYPTPQAVVPVQSSIYAPILPPVIYTSPVLVIPRFFHPGSHPHHGRRP